MAEVSMRLPIRRFVGQRRKSATRTTVTQALGAGLVNVLHIFNPDVIVIGGGVSNNWDYLWPSVQSYIAGHAMSHVQERGFRVVVSPLGDDAGLLGAAALVWQSSA